MSKPPELELKPIVAIEDRPVSITEYYHACVGTAKHSLESPRECICIIEGQFERPFNEIDLSSWETALQKATHANPGARAAITGKRSGTFWNSNGQMPRLRQVDNEDWDGLSDSGSEFITETPLSLYNGSSTELILVDGKKQFVILRTLHAVMDGIGFMHFFQEIFRALREESLVGTNACLPDLELMALIDKHKVDRPKGPPPYATGGARGNTTGDSWKAIQLTGTKRNTLARTMLAIAKTAANYSGKPTRIALPIDLRRHFPGMTSTFNYTSMLHMDINGNDSPEQVTDQLKQLLDQNAEAMISSRLNILKLIPMPLMDSLVCRTSKNYLTRRILETAVVSGLGVFKPAKFSGGEFKAKRLMTIPIPGNTMISISTLGKETCITIGIENIYASEGRLDELANNIKSAVAR